MAALRRSRRGPRRPRTFAGPPAHRGFGATAVRSEAAAERTRDRRGEALHRPGSRRSAAERPTGAQPSKARGRPSCFQARECPPSRPRQAIQAFPLPGRNRSGRPRGYASTRPLRQPSCRGSGRPALGRQRSRPRQGLGGDHSRREVLPGAIQRGDGMIEVRRRHLVPIWRLKAGTGEDEDGARLSSSRGRVDDTGPARGQAKAKCRSDGSANWPCRC